MKSKILIPVFFALFSVLCLISINSAAAVTEGYCSGNVTVPCNYIYDKDTCYAGTCSQICGYGCYLYEGEYRCLDAPCVYYNDPFMFCSGGDSGFTCGALHEAYACTNAGCTWHVSGTPPYTCSNPSATEGGINYCSGSCGGYKTCIDGVWTGTCPTVQTENIALGETCFDNLDNDCDGLKDCADSGCNGGSSSTATITSQGYNNDGTKACCQVGQCVHDGACYSQNSTLNIDTNEAVCVAGAWKNPDDLTIISGVSLCDRYSTTPDCYCTGTCNAYYEGGCGVTANNMYCSNCGCGCTYCSFEECTANEVEANPLDIQNHKFAKELSLDAKPLNNLGLFTVPGTGGGGGGQECTCIQYTTEGTGCLQTSSICPASAGGCKSSAQILASSPTVLTACTLSKNSQSLNPLYKDTNNVLSISKTKCCGDDAADLTDPDCGYIPNTCTYNGQTYAQYSTNAIGNSEGNLSVCFNSTWYDPDSLKITSGAGELCDYNSYSPNCFCDGTCTGNVEGNCHGYPDNAFCTNCDPCNNGQTCWSFSTNPGACYQAVCGSGGGEPLYPAVNTKPLQIQEHVFSNELSLDAKPLLNNLNFGGPGELCCFFNSNICISSTPLCPTGCKSSLAEINGETNNVCVLANHNPLFRLSTSKTKCCGDDAADATNYDCGYSAPCVITGVSIIPTIGAATLLGQGQSLTATITYSGDCSSANIAQIDLSSSDNSCIIQNNGVNMQGITKTSATFSGGTYTYTYTIPAIPDVCAAKTLTKIDAALYKDSLSTVKSNYYSGTFSGITLNQCYGKTLVSYPSWAPVFSAVKYLSTNTYYGTCVNNKVYAAVIVNETTKGVKLTNIYGGNPVFYSCGITDNVCPDSFVNSDGSGANICSSNNIIDEDCLPRVEMRCGNVSMDKEAPYANRIQPSSCNVVNNVAKNCPHTTDCVYADETTGTNAICYPIGSTITNKDGKIILCQNTLNYWCPDRFRYITQLNYNVCIRNFADPCDEGTIGHTNNCTNPFTNTTKCLSKDPVTQKYNRYCGVIQEWGTAPNIYQLFDWVGITVK